MTRHPGRGWLLVLAALLSPARGLSAGDVELAPFVGVQYGGSFDSVAGGQRYSMASALVYGATVDVAISESWGVELSYSRAETEASRASGADRLDLRVERYLAGIREEKGEGRARFFGVFLVGITRFAPGLRGYDAAEAFTLGLSLGVKSSLSKRFGLRGEARGFFVSVASGGGTVCLDGSCLFRYSASGLLQGDVTGAVVVKF